MHVAKTKALISCAVTAQLICVFVFAYAKSPFSHDATHLIAKVLKLCIKQVNRVAHNKGADHSGGKFSLICTFVVHICNKSHIHMHMVLHISF